MCHHKLELEGQAKPGSQHPLANAKVRQATPNWVAAPTSTRPQEGGGDPGWGLGGNGSPLLGPVCAGEYDSCDWGQTGWTGLQRPVGLHVS